MKKQLDVHELRVGMYVCELDRPWVGTPFLFQGFLIRSDDELEQLRQCCQHVFIETEIPDEPVGTTGRRRSAMPKVQPADERDVARALEFRLLKNPTRRDPAPHRYVAEAPLREEMGVARASESHTRQVIYTIMDDVRLGRNIDAAGAKQAVAGMVESVIRNPDALVWLTQLKSKDEYTALHSVRVCVLAITFGRHLELTPEQLNLLGIGALLHDVGKLKVPNEILNKPARLTDAEFTLMKTHVPRGVEILQNTPGIPIHAIEVAQRHHERYNGAGYSSGYSGNDIGLYGLIGAIVDSYDAITSDRAYHAGLSPYDALDKLYQARNADFHTGLVEQFIQCMGIYPIGSIVELNSGSIGVVISINRVRRLKPQVALVLHPDKQPCTPATVVDLIDGPRDAGGRVLEIRRVLPAGAYGINPAAYLPADS